ncbi:sulfonate ABC transporter ATP-binding protein [Bordetella sp. N]|nr:sulfonate ABC transporter ATP-binding protein [Bordetella sp. N]
MAWLHKVSRNFDGRAVLQDVSLDLNEGEFIALIGKSGSGKSTLLRILSGLDGQAQGHIEAAPRTGYVFQDARLVPWKRVWENITLGVAAGRTARRAMAVDLLREVGLEDRVDAYPATLSGGQAQRCALCRALLREPRLLLLDEPFGALDALTRMQMQTLVAGLWARHRMAALLVTHDVEEALLLADRVLVLDQGRIVSSLTVTLPRPRSRTLPALQVLRERLLQEFT